MLPILTFLAYGFVGWFPPSPLYPNPESSICATNLAPIGTTLLLYSDKARRSAICRVVGKIASSHGSQTVNVSVSAAVRKQLGFNRTASLRVYRAIGDLPPCAVKPPPSVCSAPPAACIVNVPQPALAVCLPNN